MSFRIQKLGSLLVPAEDQALPAVNPEVLKELLDSMSSDGQGNLVCSFQLDSREMPKLAVFLTRFASECGIDSHRLVADLGGAVKEKGYWVPVKTVFEWNSAEFSEKFRGTFRLLKKATGNYQFDILIHLTRIQTGGQGPVTLKIHPDSERRIKQVLAGKLGGAALGEIEAASHARSRYLPGITAQQALAYLLNGHSAVLSDRIATIADQFVGSCKREVCLSWKTERVLKTDGVTRNDLIIALNHTFYSSLDRMRESMAPEEFKRFCRAFPGKTLVDVLSATFPGMAIFLDPVSSDIEKVMYYAQKKGSMGQYLFASRKMRPDLPSTVDMARAIGRNEAYWNEREWDHVPMTRELYHWVRLFLDAGLPMKDLAAISGHDFLARENVTTLVVQAMGNKSQQEIQAETGINDSIFTRFLNHSAELQFAPETIAELCRALPTLDGGKVYRLLYPEIVRFFPEASGPKPFLDLSEITLEEVAGLNSSLLLYAHRMDHGIDANTLADQLGIDNAHLKLHETTWHSLGSEQALLGIADILARKLMANGISWEAAQARARRIVYLHFKMPLLGIFNIRLKTDESPARLSPDAVRAALEQRANTLHETGTKKELPAILRRRFAEAHPDHQGPVSVRELRQFFVQLMGGSITYAKTEAFLAEGMFLNTVDVFNLAAHIPEVSLQQWYEYVNHASLEYFLGLKSDGTINYEFPEGLSASRFESLLEAQVVKLYGTWLKASEAVGISNLKRPTWVKAILAKPATVQDLTLARLAKGLQIDRRLVYFYFRQEELRNMRDESPVITGSQAQPIPFDVWWQDFKADGSRPEYVRGLFSREPLPDGSWQVVTDTSLSSAILSQALTRPFVQDPEVFIRLIGSGLSDYLEVVARLQEEKIIFKPQASLADDLDEIWSLILDLELKLAHAGKLTSQHRQLGAFVLSRLILRGNVDRVSKSLPQFLDHDQLRKRCKIIEDRQFGETLLEAVRLKHQAIFSPSQFRFKSLEDAVTHFQLYLETSFGQATLAADEREEMKDRLAIEIEREARYGNYEFAWRLSKYWSASLLTHGFAPESQFFQEQAAQWLKQGLMLGIIDAQKVHSLEPVLELSPELQRLFQVDEFDEKRVLLLNGARLKIFIPDIDGPGRKRKHDVVGLADKVRFILESVRGVAREGVLADPTRALSGFVFDALKFATTVERKKGGSFLSEESRAVAYLAGELTRMHVKERGAQRRLEVALLFEVARMRHEKAGDADELRALEDLRKGSWLRDFSFVVDDLAIQWANQWRLDSGMEPGLPLVQKIMNLGHDELAWRLWMMALEGADVAGRAALFEIRDEMRLLVKAAHAQGYLGEDPQVLMAQADCYGSAPDLPAFDGPLVAKACRQPMPLGVPQNSRGPLLNLRPMVKTVLHQQARTSQKFFHTGPGGLLTEPATSLFGARFRPVFFR